MAALYERVRAAAEGGVARRPAVVVVGALVVLLALSGTAVFVLQAFPNSGDESCYVYQAETFALGRVTSTPHAQQPFFEAYHVRQVDGRLFSVFPPGWPAVLALALLAGVPLWLVTPALGVLTLGLTFVVGRRLHGERAASAAVLVMAVSPFFVFNSASYFAHALCAVLVLCFVWSGLRALDAQGAWWAAGAGAALGAALLTRNYTAVLCGLPFLVAVLRRGRSGRPLLAGALLAGLPFVALALAYNQATMGHPWSIGAARLETYDRFWFPDGWFIKATSITAERLGRLVIWTPPALLFLLPLAWRDNRRGGARTFVDWIVPTVAAGYFFYVNRGGNQYGPRFYYDVFPLVVLPVVASLLREATYEDKTPIRRFAWCAFVVSVVASVPMTLAHARVERAVVLERSEPFALVAAQRIDHALVFIATGSGWTRPMGPRDLTRNDPDRSGGVLYVHDMGAGNASLMRAYPGRSYYRYRFDSAVKRGTLERMTSTGR